LKRNAESAEDGEEDAEKKCHRVLVRTGYGKTVTLCLTTMGALRTWTERSVIKARRSRRKMRQGVIWEEEREALKNRRHAFPCPPGSPWR